MKHSISLAIHCDDKEYITLSLATWEIKHRINWKKEKTKYKNRNLCTDCTQLHFYYINDNIIIIIVTFIEI